MKLQALTLLSLLLLFTTAAAQDNATNATTREVIHQFLDEWHRNAANAEQAYFEKMAEDGIYIGTDKTEHWTKATFRKWSEKYFESGNTWDFTAIERNVYLSENGSLAWFDELLDTWMGTCRASGVLSKTNEGWEIEHYHLSLAIPNDRMKAVLEVLDDPKYKK